MASTINLQKTIKWAAPFINFQPLSITGDEPAITCGDLVMQTMLGPPFCWPWNRGVMPLNLITSTQDYLLNVADFNFLEKASVQDPTSSDIKEISVENSLSPNNDVARPSSLSAQADDDAGNITFRFTAKPDKNYIASIMYQRRPLLMSSLASLWSPIPDRMGYIVNWGFLTFAAILNKDSRFPIFRDMFLSHLLGAQEGLDEMKRNIFLGNWLEVTKAAERANLKTQQGIQSRAK